MSRLTKFLRRPRISRLITFGVVVVLIATSAYFAYKRIASADATVACTVKLKDGVSIQYDSTQSIDQTRGAIVNGWSTLNLIFNGNTTQFISNQNRYINVYGQGGSSYLYSKGSNKVSAVPQPVQPEVKSATFDCNGGKTIEVTSANTSRTGTQQILFNVITPTANTNGPYCISRIANVDKQGTYQKTGSDYTWVSGENFGGLDQTTIDGATGMPNYRANPGACTTGTGGGATTATTHCINYYGTTDSYEGTFSLLNNIYTRQSITSGSPPSTIDKTTVDSLSTRFSVTDSACTAGNVGGTASPTSNASPVGSNTCPSGKINASNDSSMGCQPCNMVTLRSPRPVDMFQPINSIEFASLCPTQYHTETTGISPVASPVASPNAPGSGTGGTAGDTSAPGNGTGGTTAPGSGTGGSIWKCFQLPNTTPVKYDWFYKVSNGDWRRKDGSIELNPNNLPTASSNSSADCGSIPPTTPTDAVSVTPNATVENAAQGTNGVVNVPVAGVTGNAATLKTGQVAFSAWRYSKSASDGSNYVTVGGVSLSVSGKASDSAEQTTSTNAPSSSTSSQTFANASACTTLDNWNSFIGHVLYRGSVTDFNIITPDNGVNKSITNLLKLPVGYYKISTGRKNGLSLQKAVCFAVNENTTKEVKVLLTASPGAEPPGIAGVDVDYDKTSKNVDRYWTSDRKYLYLPSSPYYGWQPVQGDESVGFGYDSGKPVGINPTTGELIPGLPSSLGIPYGGMSQLASACNKYAINANIKLDGTSGAILGAVMSFLGQKKSNTSGKVDITQVLATGLLGYVAGNNTGSQGIDVTLGQLQSDCSALQNFQNSYYNGYGTNLLNSAAMQLPFINR